MADVGIKGPAGASAPLTYTLSPAAEFIPRMVKATFDGTSATSAFYPTLVLKSAGGLEVARIPTSSTVAAGGSAEVTWFPWVGGAGAAAAATPIAAGNTTTVQAVGAGSNLDVSWDQVNTAGTGWSWTAGDPTKAYYAGSGVFACQVIVQPDTDWPAAGTGQIGINPGVDDAGTNYYNIVAPPLAEHPAIDLYSPAASSNPMFANSVAVGAAATPDATCFFSLRLSNTTSSSWSLFEAEFVVWRIGDFVNAF